MSQFLRPIERAASGGEVLDMACGRGRNGLFLIANNIPVVFADASQQALAEVQQSLDTEQYQSHKQLATLWPVDLELAGSQPFEGREFAVILVFRYLHRPLLESLMKSVPAGGLVVYETFTVDQPKYGRPRNPDFLLKHGELAQSFAAWDILHSFEGVVGHSQQEGGDGSPVRQAIAQIVARKPTESCV